MEQDAIGPLIETDLRLAVNEGLDSLVVNAVADSGFEAPGSNPLLVSIRRAVGDHRGVRLHAERW